MEPSDELAADVESALAPMQSFAVSILTTDLNSYKHDIADGSAVGFDPSGMSIQFMDTDGRVWLYSMANVINMVRIVR